MDREYLEDYNQKERSEYERLVMRRIREGKFSFEKDKHPPDNRFINLQKPVAKASFRTFRLSSLWATIPFCGSVILPLPPYQLPIFERFLFKITEIPKVIDFIKETGRLQVVLVDPAVEYVGLDHLDPFFKELRPPVVSPAPFSIFGNEKEVRMAMAAFFTVGAVGFLDFLWKISQQLSSRMFKLLVDRYSKVFVTLKLGHYTFIEDIKNFMIDDPFEAIKLLTLSGKFITNPFCDLRFDLRNFTLEDIRESQVLPLVYRPEKARFPCEIGKFLLKKLTHAAQDVRACYDLIDHYDAYDLQKVQESLNEAIVTNHPDIINKSTEELSEILDNVWNDPAIPRQIKNVKRGLPISIAAIGSAVSAFTGGLEGFLAGLGFSVGAKFLDVEIEGLAERLVKFFARSYQANVYDFKKKYKHRIVSK